VTVFGPLTDTELRATAVPVSGPLTDTELRATEVGVVVANGSDIALGNTADAAVDTDTTGTVSGKLRGLVKLMVNLLSRWPASLGQKNAAGSSPVIMSYEQTAIPIKSDETWFAFRGLTVIDDIADGEDGPGGINTKIPVYALRGADDSGTPTQITTNALIGEFFRGNHASFNGDPVWIWIPLAYSGWRNFWIHVRNNLGVQVAVTVYGVMVNRNLFSTGSAPLRQIADSAGSVEILGSTNVADAATLKLGNGGATLTAQCQWPFQWVLVKLDPDSDPATGYWSLFCSLAA
jgi:hypothetical protein